MACTPGEVRLSRVTPALSCPDYLAVCAGGGAVDAISALRSEADGVRSWGLPAGTGRAVDNVWENAKLTFFHKGTGNSPELTLEA